VDRGGETTCFQKCVAFIDNSLSEITAIADLETKETTTTTGTETAAPSGDDLSVTFSTLSTDRDCETEDEILIISLAVGKNHLLLLEI